jgi:hypothetical protein
MTGFAHRCLSLPHASTRSLSCIPRGDVSNTGSKKELDHFLELVQAAVPGIPLIVILGNHELHEGACLFEQTIGPHNYVIENARLNLKVIVMDNAEYSLKTGQLDRFHASQAPLCKRGQEACI